MTKHRSHRSKLTKVVNQMIEKSNDKMWDDLVLGKLETFSKENGFYPSPKLMMYKLREYYDSYYTISLDKIIARLDKLKEEQQKHVIEISKGLDDTNIPTCLHKIILEFIIYRVREDNVSKKI